jgi:hypothetical protein
VGIAAISRHVLVAGVYSQDRFVGYQLSPFGVSLIPPPNT